MTSYAVLMLTADRKARFGGATTSQTQSNPSSAKQTQISERLGGKRKKKVRQKYEYSSREFRRRRKRKKNVRKKTILPYLLQKEKVSLFFLSTLGKIVFFRFSYSYTVQASHLSPTRSESPRP